MTDKTFIAKDVDELVASFEKKTDVYSPSEFNKEQAIKDIESLTSGICAQTGSFAMLERFGIEIPRPTYLFMPRYSGETLAKRFIHETKVIHKGELFL